MKRRLLLLSLTAVLGLALFASWWLVQVDPLPVTTTAPAATEAVVGTTAPPPESDEPQPVRPMPTPAPVPSGGVRDDGAPPGPSDAPSPPRPLLSGEKTQWLAEDPDLHVGADASGPFTLNGPGLKAALLSKRGEVKRCYEAWYQANPAPGTELLVAFAIASDDAGTGAVARAEIVDGGSRRAALEECVLAAVAPLRFEAPGEDLQVLFPYALGPDAG